ncbi:DUF2281 domain-containing protein [Calothrix sp. CCY 0018]|uniref:DUF2281 domain-containing protein n=1 Tax=Calothrix sp. CCY 0018 TaxID=3103864 RepID=UPI0039C75570
MIDKIFGLWVLLIYSLVLFIGLLLLAWGLQPEASMKENPSIKRYPAKAGSAKGLVWMSDDFDEPLEEFKEYMK